MGHLYEKDLGFTDTLVRSHQDLVKVFEFLEMFNDFVVERSLVVLEQKRNTEKRQKALRHPQTQRKHKHGRFELPTGNGGLELINWVRDRIPTLMAVLIPSTTCKNGSPDHARGKKILYDPKNGTA